jgi:hypothetical protein
MKHLLGVGAAVGILLLGAGSPARAGVFTTGGTYDVTATDFPTNFGPTTVTLDGTTKSLGGGLPSVTEIITPVDATTAFIEFDFTTTLASLAGDINANFSLAIANIPIQGNGVLSNPFVYLASGGTPFSPLTAGSGFTVMTNPLTFSGDVFDFLGFVPTPVSGSFGLNVFSNPFNFVTSLGADVSSANELVFGAEVTIPEPLSVTLLLSALSGLMIARRRRR